jgi:acetyl esterase/lipase
MLNRRFLLISTALATLIPRVAQAGLRDRLKAQREGDETGKTKKSSPVTVDYGPALLDIYAPEGARNLPVFMHVHGGAWKFGSRKNVQAKPRWFMDQGYVFVSIDYRMLPDAHVATQADDIEAAYAYVRTHIAKHGGDPARIAVSGHSAGCHLVALAGMRGGLPGTKALVLNDVDVYDIQRQADIGVLRDLHYEAFPDKALWKTLSPATYVAGRTHPPVFIAYSKIKSHKQSAIEFTEKLRAAGTQVSLYDGSAYSHFAINRNFGNEENGLTGAVKAFLASAMR